MQKRLVVSSFGFGASSNNYYRGSWIFVATIAIIGVASNLSHQIPSLCLSSTVGISNKASVRDKDATASYHYHEYHIPEFKVHSPCPESQSSLDYNATNITERVVRFRTAPSNDSSWVLSSSNGGNNGEGGHYNIQFQLLECPPQTMASTFHIQSATRQSIFTGTIGQRYKIENGCGYYNASVPIVILPSAVGNVTSQTTTESRCGCGKTAIPCTSIVIEAFWTSRFRNYHNRMQDIQLAMKIKANKDNYTSEDIATLLGEDRLEYLARHLDVLPGFPLALELPLDVVPGFDSPSSSTNDKGDTIHKSLPNCSDVPITDWLPVGISSLSDEATWQFQSAKCKWTKWTRDDLDYWLAGLRIKYLADSHGEFENHRGFEFICPEAQNATQFFSDRYDCPQQPNNTFSFGWRFFRGIVPDHDHLSNDLRNVDPTSCSKLLGIGYNNVTIITTPTWLFVYEIEESLNDYISSLRDTIQLCRQLHPAQMKKMVLLLQSPTAADVFPNVAKQAADEWRGNHNFREESFTHALYDRLGDLVDGIIPVFEWTLARNWKQRTSDGVHQTGTYYSDIIHLQSSAIISAMKYSKGWQVPLMPMHDNRTHWFYGVPLE